VTFGSKRTIENATSDEGSPLFSKREITLPRGLSLKGDQPMKNKNRTQAKDQTAVTVSPEIVVEDSRVAATASSREDRIRELAHQRWQTAGCPECDGLKFWLEAERELDSL
jgi:hypothetical protein